VSEITFNSDTKQRKLLFTGTHFAHPAKMHYSLLMWIVENFTKEGEVILDPMAGSGTTMLACRLGRNVILNELEAKFVKMQQENWAKVQTFGAEMGYSMGQCKISQADARQLDSVLADTIISSPPYHDTEGSAAPHKWNDSQKAYETMAERAKLNPRIHNYTPEARQRYEEMKASGLPEHPGNIGNLPYGNLADVIVSSPPYAEAQSGGGIAQKGYQGPKHSPTDLVGKRSYMPDNAGGSEGQISQLPYGSIDAVITSPPYEGALEGTSRHTKGGIPGRDKKLGQTGPYADCVITSPPYEATLSEPEDRKHSIDQTKWGDGRKIAPPHSQVHQTYPASSLANIGNFKGQTYLSAMMEVYQACYRILKPQGLMILVTKNFIRNKQIVRLDEDTIKICEQAGFEFQERHYRKLTSQSFWRTIYQQKYPDAPVLNTEDVLVFRSYV
jgi:DNA modification methylase